MGKIKVQGFYGSDNVSSVRYREKDNTKQKINRAVSAFGIECPIIREGDNIGEIVVKSILDSGIRICDGDVIGITESVVARSLGRYVSIDQISESVSQILCKNNCKIQPTVTVYMPIYSRNRFAMILKGIARAAYRIVFVMPDVDEVGNVLKNHPFTGIDYRKYYEEICKSENCEMVYPIYQSMDEYVSGYFNNALWESDLIIDCRMHPDKDQAVKFMAKGVNTPYITLRDICSDFSEWGLLGSNKSTEEKLKLFPSNKDCLDVCNYVKERIGSNVYVCVYGDGCFKDPVAGIWEFADPVSMPGFTDGEKFMSSPNELKMKALIDQNSDNSVVENELKRGTNNGVGEMSSMGTTPRLRRDLLASLMDLISGSGDRATPVVVVKNYF